MKINLLVGTSGANARIGSPLDVGNLRHISAVGDALDEGLLLHIAGVETNRAST